MSYEADIKMVEFLRKAGVKIEYHIYHIEDGYLKGKDLVILDEVDWSGVKDFEALGRDLADKRYELLEDWDEGYVIDRAWERLEEWTPEDEESNREMRKGFTMAAEEIIHEWREEARYGHPSLTASERNPGLR